MKWATSGSHAELTVGGIVCHVWPRMILKSLFSEREGKKKIQTKILNNQEISVMT